MVIKRKSPTFARRLVNSSKMLTVRNAAAIPKTRRIIIPVKFFDRFPKVDFLVLSISIIL